MYHPRFALGLLGAHRASFYSTLSPCERGVRVHIDLIHGVTFLLLLLLLLLLLKKVPSSLFIHP